MVFLGGPHQAAGRRHIFLHAATCAAFLIVGAATLSGCGGGGGTPDPNASPTVTTATVSGRIIEDTTQANIAGAVIRLGDAVYTTGSDGQFVVQIPGGGAARTLFVELPSGQYYSIGSYSGSSCVRLTSQGIPIAQTSLESGDITNIGDIKVYSAASDSPPPPPCAF